MVEGGVLWVLGENAADVVSVGGGGGEEEQSRRKGRQRFRPELLHCFWKVRKR